MKKGLKIVGKVISKEVAIQGMGGYYSPYTTTETYYRQGCRNYTASFKINEQKLIEMAGLLKEGQGIRVGKISLKGTDIGVGFMIATVWYDGTVEYTMATSSHWANSQNWWPDKRTNLPLIGEAIIAVA